MFNFVTLNLSCTAFTVKRSCCYSTFLQFANLNCILPDCVTQVFQGMTPGGQLIAVKEVQLPTTSQSEAQSEFEKLQSEVDILKEMKHPNIVR